MAKTISTTKQSHPAKQLETCDCCGFAKDPATMEWLENEPLFCCRECRAEEAACGCSDTE